jgi:hypothetical protein
MKSFLKFAATIPANYLPRIERSITHAVEVMSDPNSTSEAYFAVSKELADIQLTIGKGAAKAWKGEVAERLKTVWIDAGRNGIDIERQVAPKITRVVDSAEKIRTIVRSGLWADIGKLVLGLGTFTLVSVVVGSVFRHDTGNRKTVPVVPQYAEERQIPPSPNPIDEVPAPTPAPGPPPTRWNNMSEADSIAFAAKLAELKKLPPEPQAVRAVPIFVNAQVVQPLPPPSGFNPPILPALRVFAITACRAPDEAAIVSLYSPHYNFAYKDQDDRLAYDLDSGMSDCSRRLFYQLITMIRNETYWKVDRQWIRTAVLGDQATQNTLPPYNSEPPKDTEVGCFMQPDPFGGPPYRVCPKQ